MGKKIGALALSRFAVEELDQIGTILGGYTGVVKLLEGRLAIEPLWHKKDGTISFSVTSDGTTGPEWVARHREKGFPIGESAEKALLSPDFKPTRGVTTKIIVPSNARLNVAVSTSAEIRAIAAKHKFTAPNAEVACLVLNKFTDYQIKAMGIWELVIMSEPLKCDHRVASALLCVTRCHPKPTDVRLDTYGGEPDRRWRSQTRFAFAVSGD